MIIAKILLVLSDTKLYSVPGIKCFEPLFFTQFGPFSRLPNSESKCLNPLKTTKGGTIDSY